MSELKSNPGRAVDELRALCPRHRLITLMAIQPKENAKHKNGVATRTYERNDIAGMQEFVEDNNLKRGWNVYFMRNEAAERISKKADKADVALIHGPFVDVDHREISGGAKNSTAEQLAAHIAAENERIAELFANRWPAALPRLTRRLFSGGGRQGLWDYSEPVSATAEAIERVESQSRFAARSLDGDLRVTSVDHVLRVPSTINYPDFKKREKGRVPVLATFENGEGALYAPDDLPSAKAAPEPPPPGLVSVAVAVQPGAVRRIQNLDELNEWNVPDRVKVIITQGCDPDNPKATDNSRSAWLFDVVCQLVRCSVPDDLIYSVITDPDLKISESVLGAKSVHKYALRQIVQAKEHAIDPWLRTLNSRYACAMIGGKFRVFEVVDDPHFPGRVKINYISRDDFAALYANKSVEVGKDKQGNPVTRPVGGWWLQHPMRRQYEGVVFLPGSDEVVAGSYNLWQGFGVEPREGSCTLFLQHIREVICAANEAHYNYLIRWCARLVQQPGLQGDVAIALRGGEGVGKGWFTRSLGRLLGNAYVYASDDQKVLGDFNGLLMGAVLLHLDEAVFAGDRRAANLMKSLITEPEQTVQLKFVDSQRMRNCTHILISSNEGWICPVSLDDRRYLVLDVSKARQNDRPYFLAIKRELESGGYGALLHYLLNLDISDWDHFEIPDSAAKVEQKTLSLRGAEKIVYDLLRSGDPPLYVPDDGGSGSIFIPTEVLATQYVSSRAVASELGLCQPKEARGTHRESVAQPDGSKRQLRGVWMPPLDQARLAWAAEKRLAVKWPSDDDAEWVGSSRRAPF